MPWCTIITFSYIGLCMKKKFPLPLMEVWGSVAVSIPDHQSEALCSNPQSHSQIFQTHTTHSIYSTSDTSPIIKQSINCAYISDMIPHSFIPSGMTKNQICIQEIYSWIHTHIFFTSSLFLERDSVNNTQKYLTLSRNTTLPPPLYTSEHFRFSDGVWMQCRCKWNECYDILSSKYVTDFQQHL